LPNSQVSAHNLNDLRILEIKIKPNLFRWCFHEYLKTIIYELRFMISIKLMWPIVILVLHGFTEIFFSTFPPISIAIFICSAISLKKKNSFQKGKNISIFQSSIVHSYMRVGFLMVVLFDKSKQNHWLWMFWMHNKNEGGEIQRGYAWIIWIKNFNSKNNCQKFYEIVVKCSYLNKWYEITNIA